VTDDEARALDALVAEQIFDFTFQAGVNEEGEDYWRAENEAGDLIDSGWGWLEGGLAECEGVPHYSTDIAAAWLVVEKAIDYVAATTDADWHGTGKPTRHKWEMWFGERGAKTASVGVGFGATAPEAICRAALSALASPEA
jgi:hypothetical protein